MEGRGKADCEGIERWSRELQDIFHRFRFPTASLQLVRRTVFVRAHAPTSSRPPVRDALKDRLQLDFDVIRPLRQIHALRFRQEVEILPCPKDSGDRPRRHIRCRLGSTESLDSPADCVVGVRTLPRVFEQHCVYSIKCDSPKFWEMVDH